MARKILLADDSVTAQNMGRKILADAGYEVVAVNNGSAALKKIAELKPDLVILDVYMPGYSGLEVCQRLKESPETSRIPVLLSVGKLEPFKPEEAQRVRADGYIVKPFEASELLSALSKLEDKVVPRAEPSKPGRFARAMAAADDSDRGSKNEPSSSETGWKNRISFPHNKTDAEETVAEEAQPASRSSEKSANKKDKRNPAAAETTVDVAAFAPIGVPKDVTAAEVAAITAAAAQMQMAEAHTAEDRKSDDRRSSAAPSQAAVPQTTGEFAVEPALERFQDSRADEIQSNSGAEINGMPKSEASRHEPTNVAAASTELPAAESGHRRTADEKRVDEKRVDEKMSDEKMPGEKLEEDAPVTMAAASESAAAAIAGSPRWTAVAVPLASDEASISLDHEMQKAYAAFAAADYATSAGTVEAESNNSSAQPEATVETPAPATPIEQPSAAISNSEPAALPAPQVAAETNIETQPSPDLAQPSENLAPAAELVTPAPITEVVDPAAEMHAAPQPESPVAQPATESTNAFAPIAENSEPRLDSDAVKTTAAAWASWRQIRDTSKSDQEPQPQDSAAPESAPPDSAALAVAAGAEQALQEASSAAPTGNPSDVASIVESVLAGLRPKLMEEITRKMSEKK